MTLTAAARQRIAVGYAMIDATDAHAGPAEGQLQRFGTRQPACRALIDAHYGIGGLTAVAVWSELGDCRRFSRSDSGGAPHRLGRHRRRLRLAPRRRLPVPAGTGRRCAGRCSKPACAPPGPRSPDHAYYTAVKQRHDGKLAAISVARQLARRCYHTLRNLDPDVVYADPGLIFAGDDGPGRPPQHHESLPRSAPARRRARQPSGWTAL